MASLKGGDALKRRLANMAKKLDGAQEVRVGFLEGATYPDGTPVATVAAANEFGRPDKGQPPRPFFRQTIEQNSPNWGRQIGKLLKANDSDSAAALEAMGSVIKGQLQRSINQFTSPPLAPSTIAAKGFDKPLILTAHMLRSVDFEVVGTHDKEGSSDEPA